MLNFIGALLIDEIAQLQHEGKLGASNPVNWHRRVGGVACNAYLAASELGSAHLVSIIGDDQRGQMLQQTLKRHTHQDSALIVRSDATTGSYVAALQPDGELLLGLADAALIENLQVDEILAQLPELSAQDWVAFDCNLNEYCVRALCTCCEIPSVAAITVSPAKTYRLNGVARLVDVLFTNRAEAAVLVGRDGFAALPELSKLLCEAGFDRHVITDGGAPLLVAEHESRQLLPVPASPHGTSVNGAGDALAGATLAGLAAGLSLPQAVCEFGQPAASRVVNGSMPAPILI